MAARGRHESNIGLQEIFELEAVSLLGHRPGQESSQRALKRVLTWLQTMMVMVITAFLPELFLSVADNITDDLSLVGAATTATRVAQIHDRTLVVLLRFLVACDLSEILFELPNVVVPVNRRCYSICDVETEHSALESVICGDF